MQIVMLNLRTPFLIGRIAIRNIFFGLIIIVRLNAFLHDALPIEEMNPAKVHCEMADVVLCLGTRSKDILVISTLCSLQITLACSLPLKCLGSGGSKLQKIRKQVWSSMDL
uniref:Uncharacterized protein n=1 Tax=Tanacetum cinerariifolium TaxID=118510 RepID=A0A699KSZ9_TANCI|nr:hypothetical protein [Tanacetum cinerariifolium]